MSPVGARPAKRRSFLRIADSLFAGATVAGTLSSKKSPGANPSFSDPHADRALADTLPSPAPASRLPASCEGGTRRPGETWKVECNECSCGDDGQSRCTAMACLPRPVR